MKIEVNTEKADLSELKIAKKRIQGEILAREIDPKIAYFDFVRPVVESLAQDAEIEDITYTVLQEAFGMNRGGFYRYVLARRDKKSSEVWNLTWSKLEEWAEIFDVPAWSFLKAKKEPERENAELDLARFFEDMDSEIDGSLLIYIEQRAKKLEYGFNFKRGNVTTLVHGKPCKDGGREYRDMRIETLSRIVKIFEVDISALFY
jgi:hypothetical protein